MKSLAMFLALAIGAVAGVAATQDAAASRITVTGDVVSYEAGKRIVVRGVDGRDVAYEIAPALAVPAEVAAGRRVTIVAEPSETGALSITRITVEAGPARSVDTAAGRTAVPPATAERKSQIATEYGTVSAYEAGRSITILRPNATTVTYAIDSSSALPAGLAKGSKVVIRTISRPGLDPPIVRKVSYSKTTRTKKTVGTVFDLSTRREELAVTGACRLPPELRWTRSRARGSASF